ncbi:MAG: hypothetical protein M1830_000504 [Pleopsidium flavum]|nr:MAG: hypothetical protein M1830_000504 [Pleopsidium flavum]
MALEKTTASDYIQIDKNYLSRITLRKQILSTHPQTVLGANTCVQPAVNELYVWLMTTYLPTRFPLLFTLNTEKQTLHNTSNDDTYPLDPPSSPLETLRILGTALEDDFLFLHPSDDGDGYALQGFVTCFPSGFDTSKKLGLNVREIHAPVPGYREKLETGMDRFFERLEVGRWVKRVNWSITTHDRLFAAFGNHLYEGETPEPEDIDIPNVRLPPFLSLLSLTSPAHHPKPLNPNPTNTQSLQTHLRSERQILHRLPHSKAIVFSFKTYLYPISEIKNEGLGEELAVAVDGLRGGSVEGMWFYKRGVVWGEGVKAFLRS